MKTVLITGPIGSGKSEVSRYLRSKAYPVYDCDSGCKSLYDRIPGMKERIERELGIPFSSLSGIFSDAARLERLESIIYPLLREDILRWRRSCGSETAFIESAVALQKACFDDVYDEVLLVDAPYGVRLARNSKVRERDSLQSFDRTLANYIIVNDSSIESLHSEIEKYLNV